MITKLFGATAVSFLVLLPIPALASPNPSLRGSLVNKTLGGRTVVYPRARLKCVFTESLSILERKFRTHPSPVIVYLQQGTLTNVRVIDGVEVVETIEANSGFLEGSPQEPHYVVNNGTEPAVSIVTFASVEGMPNMNKVD